MRSANLAVGVLTLILLVAVPVGGVPDLKVGSNASYNLSVSITFSPPFCETSFSSEAPTIVYCPMVAMIPSTFNINGTLGWTITGLTNTRAVLNVTREVAMSSWDGLTAPSFRSVRSLNESIDLATRIASIMPFPSPEIDQTLQMAQNSMGTIVFSGMGWNVSANTITSDMMQRHPIYTMWWVNGPLKLNETVPVLSFPTNVTGSTNVDLGSLGTRAAWTLIYNLTLPTPSLQQQISGTAISTGDKIQAAFAFNYDQQSDLLLGASADIHLGYIEESTYQTDQCNPSTATSTTWCSDASGLSIQASLILANTSLNLDQRLVPTDPSGGSTTASGSGSGSETGSGSDSGTRSGSGTGTGGYDQDPNSRPGSGSNPGSIPQSASPKPSPGMDPGIYRIIAIALIAIIGTSLWVARRRKNRGSPAISTHDLRAQT